jgi:hypothetical protein
MTKREVHERQRRYSNEWQREVAEAPPKDEKEEEEQEADIFQEQRPARSYERVKAIALM